MASTRNNNKIVNIAARELRIHPIAQRRIVKAHLKKVMADLDLDSIGTVHVVYYEINGVLAYWVIDGQHRVEALIRRGFGDWKVKCEIHAEVTTDSEASAKFLRLNRRAPVGAFDLFQNELTAEDPVAVGVKQICESHGLRIDRTPREGYVSCVNALCDLHRRDEGLTLEETLGVLVGAAGRTPAAFDGKLILGLGRFLSTYNGQVDRAVLTTKIAKYPGGPAGLLGNAKGLARIKGGNTSLPACVAELLRDVYNKGRRGATL